MPKIKVTIWFFQNERLLLWYPERSNKPLFIESNKYRWSDCLINFVYSVDTDEMTNFVIASKRHKCHINQTLLPAGDSANLCLLYQLLPVSLNWGKSGRRRDSLDGLIGYSPCDPPVDDPPSTWAISSPSHKQEKGASSWQGRQKQGRKNRKITYQLINKNRNQGSLTNIVLVLSLYHYTNQMFMGTHISPYCNDPVGPVPYFTFQIVYFLHVIFVGIGKYHFSTILFLYCGNLNWLNVNSFTTKHLRACLFNLLLAMLYRSCTSSFRSFSSPPRKLWPILPFPHKLKFLKDVFRIATISIVMIWCLFDCLLILFMR